MILGRLLAWAVEDVSDVANVVRVFTGLGVGGILAGAFFYLLHKQSDNHKEQLKIVRRERAQDIARLERRLDQLYARLGMPPDKEGVVDDELP